MPASRTVFAAAHVVADPNAANNAQGAPAVVDWDATLAFRHRLWSLGLGIADAMDTAQRGMGLDWAATKELIRRSGAEAQTVGGLVCCGVGTDQLPGAPTAPYSLAEIGDAYEGQLEVVEQAGALPVLMCSRALASSARGAEDYAEVYARIIGQASSPVILHWLGDMFDPALKGYWGSADLDVATESVLAIIDEHAAKIDGIKVSLLDADREIALRRRLPEGVRLYTGDDFNFPELIAGDEQGFSHALLGIFVRAARRGRRGRIPRRARPAGPAGAAHLRGADAVLQDRRRVPRVPVGLSGALQNGRRPGDRPRPRASDEAVRDGRGRRDPPGRRSGRGALQGVLT